VYDGRILDGGSYRFATHNGDIALGLAENANATVGVATFSGDFESAFKIQPVRAQKGHRFTFALGNGSAKIDLESFQGSIELLKPGGSVLWQRIVEAWREHEREHAKEWKWGDKDFKWEMKGEKKNADRLVSEANKVMDDALKAQPTAAMYYAAAQVQQSMEALVPDARIVCRYSETAIIRLECLMRLPKQEMKTRNRFECRRRIFAGIECRAALAKCFGVITLEAKGEPELDDAADGNRDQHRERAALDPVRAHEDDQRGDGDRDLQDADGQPELRPPGALEDLPTRGAERLHEAVDGEDAERADRFLPLPAEEPEDDRLGADQDRHADGEREHRDPLQVLDERAAEAAELVLEQ